MKILRLIRYWWAWRKWYRARPRVIGSPYIGKTRAQRNRNLHMIWDRHDAQEPKKPS